MTHLLRRAVLSSFIVFATAGLAAAQLTQDQQAEMTLSSARKAYNEKNYPFAASRFREYLSKFPNHKDANAARYGLALTLIDGPEKDRKHGDIQQLLVPLTSDKSFADQAAATYQLALSYRTQGMDDLARAAVNPGEAPQRRESAMVKFEQAAGNFAKAVVLFEAKAANTPDKEFSEPWEWAARSRCDQSEMLLRIGKTKEARAAAEPFLKHPQVSRSACKDAGRLIYGHAAFILGDIPAAQKSLTMLAPFAGGEIGPHARYFLGRTHHLSDERGDALNQYEAAIAGYKKAQEDAAKLLKEPQKWGNDPAKRAELEALVRQPLPEHIARAHFYLGVLLYEAGRFGEAKTRFQEFVKQLPVNSPLKAEADLRVAFCQVQNKEAAEAIKTLQPLLGNDKISDQAFFWLGKAQAGIAPDPTVNWQDYRNAMGHSIASLRAAYEHARRLGNSPEGTRRRGEIQLELGDELQAIKEPREAINAYQTILGERLLPDREEEVSLRIAQAFHQAKEFNESDARCQAFFQKYPKSTLSAAVAFTFAENAYFRAAALEKTPPSPERTKQLASLYDECVKRANIVLQRYPEYPKILLVRHSVGLANYRKGDFEAAAKAWNDIPAPERAGELAIVPYLLADCVLRQTPTSLPADADAIATGKLEEQLKTASELLEGFISANPKSASAADALLKFGQCQQRRAGLFSDAKDKQPMLASARSIYDKLIGAYANDPLAPQAIFERAKVMALQGDVNGAMNQMRRFSADPLRQTPVASVAAINLATFLRAQNKPVEAADLLHKVRDVWEGKLNESPANLSLVLLLRFHQGVALREAGKLGEARGFFDSVQRQAPKSPEGIEASLRFGQSLKDEGLILLDGGKKLMQNPKEAGRAQGVMNEGYKLIREASQFFETTAEQLKSVDGSQEPRARMLYEAAWGNRTLADPEIDAAKQIVAKEIAQKLGKAGERLPLPPVALDKVPLQSSEKRARGLYKSMIDQFSDVPLALDARFELAEMMSQRNEHDAALALLTELMDKEPNVDLTERTRIRLGSIHAAKGNLKAALAQFDAVAQNPKSGNLGWAQYRAAEALYQNREYPEAVKRLVLFRDNGQFQNIAGLSDRALLRLGAAYAALKAWGESYQAYERCVSQFPNGAFVDEARYGMGWAMQQQRNYDGAVNWYTQVVARSASELAAKAQYQIGACRLEQKRFNEAANAFLVVPTTYNFPELSAASMLEAAAAYREANNRGQSMQLLERLVREYAGTPFADAAKERLERK
jgi:TolA-binding protein